MIFGSHDGRGHVLATDLTIDDGCVRYLSHDLLFPEYPVHVSMSVMAFMLLFDPKDDEAVGLCSIVWGGWDSNPRPKDYESSALTG